MTVGPLATATQLETYRAGDPDMLVAAAQAVVRSYCRWHIAPSITETIVLDSNGTNTLLLPSMHVTAVSEVRDVTDTDPVVLDGWRTAATPRFRAGILERTDYCWPLGVVEVDLTHGYDETPADVQQVVHDMANRAIDVVKSAGLSRKRVGDVERAWFAGEKVTLTEDNKQALARYRIPPPA